MSATVPARVTGVALDALGAVDALGADESALRAGLGFWGIVCWRRSDTTPAPYLLAEIRRQT
jgi:hypothetical protein